GAAPAWRGHSDTETLMAGFEAWGIEATLQKTVGMFAIALWDRQDRVLTLARDRFGEKPLYYGWAGQGEAAAFVFGSELKALRAYPGFANPVCREALAQYMRFMYVPAPRSIYEGIYKLEPGCLLTVRGTPPAASPAQPLRSGSTWGNVAVQRWWSLASVVEAGARNPITDEAEAIGALEKQLQEAVRLQSLADVPLGAFLSGGVDSSAIVALMQQQSTQAVKTFTVGFEESEFDESPHARAVAQHLGTDHTALFVTAAEAQAVIPRLPAMYDEPFADSSQIPTHLVCKAARQQVTVALSGDAGDELLGGYNRYFWGPRIWNRLAWLPYPAQQALGKVLTQVPATGGGALGRTLGVVRPGEKLHKLGRAIRGVRNLDDLYMNLVSEWQDPAAVVKGVGGPVQEPASGLADPLPAAGADAGPLRMMFRDSMTYLPDDILCKVDRAAMAVSLETRVPFLDHRVAELAWRLPLHMKIRGNQGKWALRQVLYRHVPRELIERPKAGFSIPIGQWLRGPLRDWAESLLDAQRLQAEGFFHPAPIRARWAEHLAGQREHTTSLWAVLMFQAWLQEQAQTQAQTPQGTAC
ncbi:MAG: asparagine synthase (glutamine-hydrolyzing), partial [Variovorax sp.]|nr:asparagine synthase (glutamine-hydrolyzing) [Variovorax sp.]